MERWLTSRDLARILGYTDLRAARDRMKELGARKIGGEYRLPPDALDALRPDPERINARPKRDQGSPSVLRSKSSAARDPQPSSDVLAPGWWRDEKEN